MLSKTVKQLLKWNLEIAFALLSQADTNLCFDSKKNNLGSPRAWPAWGSVKGPSTRILPKAHRAAVSGEQWARNKSESSLRHLGKVVCWWYPWTGPGMDCTPNSHHRSDQIISDSEFSSKWSWTIGSPKHLKEVNADSSRGMHCFLAVLVG